MESGHVHPDEARPESDVDVLNVLCAGAQPKGALNERLSQTRISSEDILNEKGRIARLDLSKCWALTALPTELGQFAALHTLELSGCGRLTALPRELGQCTALHTLNCSGCRALTTLPPELGQCEALHTLILSLCRKLTALPPELGQCTALYNLDLSGCWKLTALPPEIGQFTVLHALNLSGCKVLQDLPPNLGQCSTLHTLKLPGCEELKALSPELGQCVALHTLNVSGCGKLAALPPEIGQCVALYIQCNSGKIKCVDVLTTGFQQSLENPLLALFLGAAVKSDPSLAEKQDKMGRRAIDVACPECMRAMRAALHFCARYDLDADTLAHVSRTCAVAFARDMEDAEVGSDGVPVALKFMSDLSAFQREVGLRKDCMLDDQLVLGTVRTHNADTDTAFQDELQKLLQADERFAHGSFRYCVVLPRAERSLHDALTHEHFAGKDWTKVRLIVAHIAAALAHMHGRGLLHGDLKPLNVMRLEGRFRLIDLDCACPLGMPFGSKQPSTAFCPPEMACAVKRATDAKTGKVNGQQLGSNDGYSCADPTYDMWSLGVVLYHLCTGCSLFHADQNDDLPGNTQLDGLCSWSRDWHQRPPHATMLADVLNDQPAAHDLLTKLLHPDPATRRACFPTMKRVLAHPFIEGKSMDAAAMQELLATMKRVEGKVDGLAVNVAKLRTFMIELEDRRFPTTFCILPSKSFLDKFSDAPSKAMQGVADYAAAAQQEALDKGAASGLTLFTGTLSGVCNKVKSALEAGPTKWFSQATKVAWTEISEQNLELRLLCEWDWTVVEDFPAIELKLPSPQLKAVLELAKGALLVADLANMCINLPVKIPGEWFTAARQVLVDVEPASCDAVLDEVEVDGLATLGEDEAKEQTQKRMAKEGMRALESLLLKQVGEDKLQKLLAQCFEKVAAANGEDLLWVCKANAEAAKAGHTPGTSAAPADGKAGNSDAAGSGAGGHKRSDHGGAGEAGEGAGAGRSASTTPAFSGGMDAEGPDQQEGMLTVVKRQLAAVHQQQLDAIKQQQQQQLEAMMKEQQQQLEAMMKEQQKQQFEAMMKEIRAAKLPDSSPARERPSSACVLQ